jgi:hypothetical protein
MALLALNFQISYFLFAIEGGKLLRKKRVEKLFNTMTSSELSSNFTPQTQQFPHHAARKYYTFDGDFPRVFLSLHFLEALCDFLIRWLLRVQQITDQIIYTIQ